jgi:hypothetical protein
VIALRNLVRLQILLVVPEDHHHLSWLMLVRVDFFSLVRQPSASALRFVDYGLTLP